MKDIKDKMIRSAILAVTVLVMVIIALVYYKAKDPQHVDSESKKIISVSIAELDTVELIDNTDEKVKVTMRFGNTNKGLELIERIAVDKTTGEVVTDFGKDPSENSIRLFEFTLTSLDSIRTITSKATNIEQYGLEDPVCEVSMVLKDGDKKRVRVGRRLVTSNNAYYMKLDDDDSIYVISQFDMNNFLMTDANIINM